MGYSYDGVLGFGVEIPDDFEPANPPEDWEDGPDLWTYLDEVGRKFGVSYAISDYMGEFGGAALFVGKTIDINGVGVYAANPVKNPPSWEELERLREAAEYIGVPYAPLFLAVTSYA